MSEIKVNVTASKQQKVTVSSIQNSTEITTSADTGRFWAQNAKNWAISDVIVDNTDYSSKHYAQEAKTSAQNAESYENSVKSTYKTFLETSANAITEIQSTKEEALTQIETSRVETVNNINTVKNTAVDDINASKTNILKDIEFVADGEKEEIQELAEKAKDDIESTGFYMRGDKLYFINSEGQEEEFKSGGGGLEIGDIGFTQMAIDESKGKRRVLNGQLIIQEQYVQFTNIIKNSVALNPSIACTETEWQTEVTMNTFGLCGKFVIDDEGGTIRLPKYPNYFVAGLANIAPVVGNGMTLGLTDGTNTGGIQSMKYSSGVTRAGEIQLIESNYGVNVGSTGTTIASGGGFDSEKVLGVTTDPTKSGIEAQIDEKQIAGQYFIQVATGAETEDNIINEIELNNPFSLLDYKFSEYELNNISWLRSQGQYNLKAVYPAVYDLLLKIYNGVETKAGVSVKLSTETFTDYDFVLNTVEETFRLPVKVKASYFENIAPVVGNGKALGLTNGSQNTGLYTDNTYGVYQNIDKYGQEINTNASGAQSGGIKGILGVTTDPTKSGIEAHLTENTDLYLYFYVGETVQNANLINAGRIEEKLVNLIPQNKELITNYNIPDYTAGVNIVSGFVAPNNGLIIFTLSCYTVNTSAKGYINNILVAERTSTAGTYGTVTKITVPVFCAKGDEITFTSTGGEASAMFYPLKGAN